MQAAKMTYKFDIGVVLDKFRAVLDDAGLIPGEIIPDGKLRRCGIMTHPKSVNGWYVLHSNPFAGAYGDWSAEKSRTWCMDGQNLSVADHERLSAEINKQRQKREAAHLVKMQLAATKARKYLSGLHPATGINPYLKSKGVTPCPGLLADSDQLVVPVQCPDNSHPMSYQTVHTDGKKRFMPDGRVSGGYFVIRGDDGPIIICEGIATGLSIYMATGQTVLVAFSAHNLLAVAQMARDRYPDRQIVVAGDNDIGTESKTGANPGVEAATKAAAAINAKVAIPVEGGDWNDCHQAHSLEVVRAGIDAARTPDQSAAVESRPAEIDWEQPIPFDNLNAPPIPQKNIPEPLCGFCGYCAEALQVPLDLVFCSALGALAAAAQGKYIVSVKGGYTEPLCIYMVAVLPPGRGSPAPWKNARPH